MFAINEDLSIYVTRGDAVSFSVAAARGDESYVFQPGNVVRINVIEKKACNCVVLQKDFPVTEATEEVEIVLTEKDTRIGGVINKPVDYWYEVELNPLTDPQTIIGYDEDGAKIFKLFPEGESHTEEEPSEEDIPIVDEELDMTSERPVQNRAIAEAFAKMRAKIKSGGAWYGKTFATFGDDISWQDREPYTEGENAGSFAKGYQSVIKERFGFASYDNYAKQNSTINRTVNVIASTDFTDKSYDLIIIAVGTRDYEKAVDVSTFSDLYREAIELLIEDNKKARIVLFTPLRRADEFIYSGGIPLSDYAEAIRAIGEEYSLPVCDLYANSGINKLNLAEYTTDGLIPNDDGYARIGACCAGLLSDIG